MYVILFLFSKIFDKESVTYIMKQYVPKLYIRSFGSVKKHIKIVWLQATRVGQGDLAITMQLYILKQTSSHCVPSNVYHVHVYIHSSAPSGAPSIPLWPVWIFSIWHYSKMQSHYDKLHNYYISLSIPCYKNLKTHISVVKRYYCMYNSKQMCFSVFILMRFFTNML